MNYNFYTSHLQLNGFRQRSATENTFLLGKFRVFRMIQSQAQCSENGQEML